MKPRAIRREILVCLLIGGLLLAGCGPSAGKRVRVATASPAELEAALNEDNVWYEFQPGDVIPVQLGFMGAMEGGAQGPVVFRAKHRFFFVTSKNGPMQISFDGKTFAGQQGSQSLIAVLPRRDGNGGQLAWMIYMGESGDPEAELKQLLESSQSSQASPPPAPTKAP
jgi:hypothetical protein